VSRATRRRRWRWVLGAYLLLLLASHLVRWLDDGPPGLAEGQLSVQVELVGAVSEPGGAVQLAYRDSHPEGGGKRPVLVLVHGSPGAGSDFRRMIEPLAAAHRVIVPDLPGFGRSEAGLPDYSARAHAAYLAQLLDALGIGSAHVIGFSMGGAVALELAGARPERLDSLTLLSATGVQELELLGDYTLNHLVHGFQLGALWGLSELTPHFGILDGAYVGVPYARNFYDTDQRPLRGILESWEGATLIVHGSRDVLVPPEAAREHHRLVPQSELALFEANHFMVFRRPGELAQTIGSFVARVENGEAPRRDQADPERLALAERPFDPASIPPARGLTLILFMGLIILATLVSEDLTLIGAGLLVADGRMEFLPAVAACFMGVTLGDMGLFLSGRILGPRALRCAPIRWMVRPERVERAREWFSRKGFIVVLVSRFVPGTRLPVYLAAGTLGMPLGLMTAFFLTAALFWIPLLVGTSMLVGRELLGLVHQYERFSLPLLFLAVAAVVVLVKGVVPLFTFRGRRSLVSLWRRWTRWEFWPPWLFYPPVLLRVAGLALRYRHPTLFTAANPAMPASGFIGESKMTILEGLSGTPELVARTRLIPAGDGTSERRRLVEAFLEEEGLDLPVVLKPDAGQRGQGVAVVRSMEEAAAYLERNGGDTLVQEHVPGEEIGVFYVRLPEEERGRIFSITEKTMPVVVGDGRRTLEELILLDPRAVAMARHYLKVNAPRRKEVPAEGEAVQLVELGTHCRGSIFLDGAHRHTPGLEKAVDRMSRAYEGFFFGRYDLRLPPSADLEAGSGFKVIELNGVTSEATHIYDPRNGLREAYRTLFEQWRLAFEVGRQNVERGARTVPLRHLAGLLLAARETS
jgi:pimeloyl-ACP methyl ester carboxylesterase/membrane protein DedA with SNARE-associated domain